MITFKEYLTESRSAPLYHGTRFRNLSDILWSNVLRGDEGRVSLTRDFNYALRFPTIQSPSNVAVIEFDQRKLTHNYKIAPFNFWVHDQKYSNEGLKKVPTRVPGNYRDDEGWNENEYEESVKGIIKNLTKYITKIYVATEKDKKELMDDYLYFNDPKFHIKIVVGYKPQR